MSLNSILHFQSGHQGDFMWKFPNSNLVVYDFILDAAIQDCESTWDTFAVRTNSSGQFDLLHVAARCIWVAFDGRTRKLVSYRIYFIVGERKVDWLRHRHLWLRCEVKLHSRVGNLIYSCHCGLSHRFVESLLVGLLVLLLHVKLILVLGDRHLATQHRLQILTLLWEQLHRQGTALITWLE